MNEEITRMWQEIAARPDGPLAFRFYLQPLIAGLLALRDGRRDAAAGRPAYFWAIFKEKNPERRSALIRQGWQSIARVFVLAIAIDIVYQIIVLHGLHLFQGILIAIILALVPYILVRGPANRIISRLHDAVHGQNGRRRV